MPDEQTRRAQIRADIEEVICEARRRTRRTVWWTVAVAVAAVAVVVLAARLL